MSGTIRSSWYGPIPFSRKDADAGTWKNPATHNWHELDGFLVKQQTRSQRVKRVSTVGAGFRLSDHRAKRLVCDIIKDQNRRNIPRKQKSIDWGKLKTEEVAARFRQGVQSQPEKLEDWCETMTLLAEVGSQVCGVRKGQKLSPWLEENHDEINSFQR